VRAQFIVPLQLITKNKKAGSLAVIALEVP